ncbi:MAG: V-type ATP synthase subunit A [Methylomonas sp.]|nr:V-type ATP synthase subunit A [Methylomonas sp.]PPD22760.1 MAG: V-type ATP synthase subunit A [Methylomonas sp.]PPD26745.1 MAG: V-type ATP synthase subunit A [Methylomonas sp.]PPD38581.1 MAG: V-type ATP synthase subunit A [Methylomonas sp.]PPD42800.1 MAG: V-type ATP synthase subunit A [Methylomonas sp.]
MSETKSTARVVAVQDGLVTIESLPAEGGSGVLRKNGIVYLCPRLPEGGPVERLKGEILRINGNLADVQVFESTLGVAVGDPVIQSGELLSATLGPGLLGQIYDGLQNPLETLAIQHGYFLPRGVEVEPLDVHKKWAFLPRVQSGDRLAAGDVIGTVQEGRFTHKIMIPFDEPGHVEVSWIQENAVTVDTPVARIRTACGEERPVSLCQRWPVRRPLPESLLAQGRVERLLPNRSLITTVRLIDTFFPIALGGTCCIPGPFGAGKTVLQQLLARYSHVDIVIVVACGERAGEVVETIAEFPKLVDPLTGGSLMDRTILICNTSSMPVAAREASIYTGITLGEYYRQMGYQVLLLADSTSRWAQAMRETSGRLEEIPGEEAFPAYLDSSIRTLYERAGVIRAGDGATGSLSLIGTVSPAGGNFEEPVTQATLATVKCFLGLSGHRAYRRCYPAIDPLISWSRYLRQLGPWYEAQLEPGWVARVQAMLDLIKRGDAIGRMMQVTGEEGVTLADWIVYQKAWLLDTVYLQQDAFDPVDVSSPLERQQMLFGLLTDALSKTYDFQDREAVRSFFARLAGLFKNLNCAESETPDFWRSLDEIRSIRAETGSASQSEVPGAL